MFVEEFPGAVPLALCQQIIACFERDPARQQSAVMRNGLVESHRRRSGTILRINRESPEWESLFMAVVPALRATMDTYRAKHPGLSALIEEEGLDCTVPIIECVEPGQGFDWHYDNSRDASLRVVAGLLYLKTVDAAGETEFAADGGQIKPQAGKIVLFPPYWTHYHRGVTPAAGPKYVMSYFWVYP